MAKAKKKPSAAQKANQERFAREAKARAKAAKAAKKGATKAAHEGKKAAKKGAAKKKGKAKAKAHHAHAQAAPKAKKHGKRKGRKSMAKRGKFNYMGVLKNAGVGIGGALSSDLAVGGVKKIGEKNETVGKIAAHPVGNIAVRIGVAALGGLALEHFVGDGVGEAFATGSLIVAGHGSVRSVVDTKFPGVLGDVADLSGLVPDELAGLVEEGDGINDADDIAFAGSDDPDDLSGDLALIDGGYR